MTDTERRFALPLDEALARAAQDREQLLGRIRAEEARTRLGLHEHPSGVLRRWEWWVADEGTGERLAAGRAWTERGMRRVRYRAYLQVLDRLREGRAAS